MKITIRKVGDVQVAQLEGALDTNAAPKAETALNRIRDQGIKTIVLNLEKLDYIASSGLRIVLSLSRRLQGDGGELRVCSLNGTVAEVFDISGFSTLISVFEDEQKALDTI